MQLTLAGFRVSWLLLQGSRQTSEQDSMVDVAQISLGYLRPGLQWSCR